MYYILLKQLQPEASLWLLHFCTLFQILPCKLAEQKEPKWAKVKVTPLTEVALHKVWTFWEEHKIWKNLPPKIWHYWVMSNFKWKIFSDFVSFSECPNFNSAFFYFTLQSSPDIHKTKVASFYQKITWHSPYAFRFFPKKRWFYVVKVQKSSKNLTQFRIITIFALRP
jgi:hypothetical protein